MEIIDYNDLPEKAKQHFLKDCLETLIKEHKQMGLDYPKDWQISNHANHLIKTCFTFVKESNRYFYFKAVSLNR